MENKQVNINNGLIIIKSAYDVKTTADRLEKDLRDKGMLVIARVDHAMAAQKIGQELRPTELIIFGNPKAGTVLIQASQSTAIDLPLKVLISEDEVGQVWLSYNDIEYLVQRHDIKNCDTVVENIQQALATFAQLATA